MKRFLIVLAALLVFQVVDAQSVKTPAQAKAAIESAKVASQHPKKATKVATWIKLAKAYVDAYEAPYGQAMVNMSKTELNLLLGNEKPLSVEQIQLEGQPITKEVYASKNLYFNANGVLVLMEATQPVIEGLDLLASAVEAYKKANAVDVKNKKVKDLTAGLKSIVDKYQQEAFTKYTLGDYAAASELFAKSAAASEVKPLSSLDTTSLYNAGYTAWMAKDYKAAKKHFEKCLDVKYYYTDGEVFSKLSDIYKELGDNEASIEILEKGFSAYPQSQSILIGLINYYIESKENPEKLFTLLDKAKANEPNNASLYYVEGNIHAQLGHYEDAKKAYDKCNVINPEYEFGYIGAGIMYYNRAIELQTEASNEMDDAKWTVLIQQFEDALLNAIEPFEKAYSVSKDESLKVNIAEYLKNIYYRFSSKDAKYKELYDKYSAIVAQRQ